MRKQYQAEYRKGLGDCFRACVASIFEFDIFTMPNFWEQTQDTREFWKLVNEWTTEYLKVKCISLTIPEEHRYCIKGLTCVATGETDRTRNDEEHAVVWRDGLLHDPHCQGKGLTGEPTVFTIFSPISLP